MSNAAHPVFDPNGKYLYFAASTNNGPSDAGIDLSSLDRATNSGVYVVVLSRDGASPVPPQSDDENKKKADEDKKDEAKKDDGKKDDAKKKDEKPKPTVIDLAGIGNRILSLPIPAKNYVDMLVGKTGVLFLAAGSAVGRSSEDRRDRRLPLWRFTAEKRETDEIVSGVSAYKVSFDGEKLFYARQDSWFLAPTADLKGGLTGRTSGQARQHGGMSAMVDPRAEWRQMYHETWRIAARFPLRPATPTAFRSPKIEAQYKPYLDGLASRAEFTYLSTEMLGEVTSGICSLAAAGPRRLPQGRPARRRLRIDNDRYRIAKILAARTGPPASLLRSPCPAYM